MRRSKAVATLSFVGSRLLVKPALVARVLPAICLLITDMNPAIELRKINIDPIWVFGLFIKKKRIPYNLTIGRIVKRIRKSRLLEFLVAFFWKTDFEITAWLLCILTVAGGKKEETNGRQDPGHQVWEQSPFY